MLKDIIKILNNDGGWVAAAATVAGALLNKSAQDSANTGNKNLSRENLRWQQIYSKNKHRFMTDDLKSAGLNPMLATGMSPGSTGGGTAQSMKPADALGTGLEATVSSAMQYKKQKSEIKALDENIKNIEAQREKTKAETKTINNSNIINKQDADFHEQNPWYRKANRYLQLLGLGTSTGGAAAAGYAIGKQKGNPTSAKGRSKNTEYKGKSPQFRKAQKRTHKLRGSRPY